MRLGNRRHERATCVLGYPKAFTHLRLIELSALYTQERHRKKGYASGLINKICGEADEVGTGLLISVDSNKLTKFYEKFGFAIFQHEPVILMARPPRGTFSE